MISQLGPRNTDSDHQRDGRQRHADGADSTAHVSICSSLSMTTRAATEAQWASASPTFRIRHSHRAGGSFLASFSSETSVLVPPGCVRRHGLALPNSFPQAFPPL